jgi:hypothetical protein
MEIEEKVITIVKRLFYCLKINKDLNNLKKIIFF